MSELTISSNNWLAISLRNGAAIVFNLNEQQQWQHLKSETNNNTDNKQQQAEEDDDNTNDLNRNLIKFTPDGQKLAINGQNKQIYIYILSDYEKTKTYWELERIITVKKRASALDLTNKLLLIADKSGDVYQIDLLSNNNITLTSDDCIMGHLSMLLDIIYLQINENQQFILTADRDEKIRLSYYPNSYNIQGYCLGHTEFVSHIKLIDQNHLLSASGDGTLRLWHLPDCIQLNVFETKIFLSSFKELFYGSTSNESLLDSSSIDYSISKMDIISNKSDSFIALSIYTYRKHSIYLTSLSNLKNSSIDQQYKLTFNSNYGIILDYYFSLNSQYDLYILFDSNIILKINILFILSYNNLNEFIKEEENNKILIKNEFSLVNNIISNEIIYKQLFKIRGNPADSSYYKRKNQRIEQQEEKRRRKQFKEQVVINNNIS